MESTENQDLDVLGVLLGDVVSQTQPSELPETPELTEPMATADATDYPERTDSTDYQEHQEPPVTQEHREQREHPDTATEL